MGTLFNQRPRADHDKSITKADVESLLDEMLDISARYKIPVTYVLSAREILELERRNNLYLQNGDTFDEQMAGFGQLIQELNETFKDALDE